MIKSLATHRARGVQAGALLWVSATAGAHVTLWLFTHQHTDRHTSLLISPPPRAKGVAKGGERREPGLEVEREVRAPRTSGEEGQGGSSRTDLEVLWVVERPKGDARRVAHAGDVHFPRAALEPFLCDWLVGVGRAGRVGRLHHCEADGAS